MIEDVSVRMYFDKTLKFPKHHESLVDFDSQPQEDLGVKRRQADESETSNKHQKAEKYFAVKSAKQVNVRKFSTTGAMLEYKLYFYVSEGFVINECFSANSA